MFSRLKNIGQQEGFIKYLKNTIWLFLEKIIRMGVGLFIGVWVTRYLGKELFGTFAYVQSLIGIFSIFATLGLDGLLVRDFLDEKINKSKLFGTALVLRLSGTVLVYLILFILLNYILPDKSIRLLCYIMALTLFFQVFYIFEFYFKSKVITKYFTFASLIAFSISSILKVLFIETHKSLIYFIWVIVVESMILSVVLVYLYHKNREVPISSLGFDKRIAFKLLKECWPLIISSFTLSLYLKMDQIMLKHYSNESEVGIYAAALRLSEIWTFIPMVISTSLFPAIIQAKLVSEEKYYKRLQSLYDFMVWLAILLAFPIALFSDYIVLFLYGNEYINSSFVLKVHIWTGIFTFFGCAWSNWILIEKYQLTSLYMNFLSLITNFILNISFIPSYGAKGAAIATLITYSLNHVFFALFFKNQKKGVKMFWQTFNLKRIYYEVRCSIRNR